LAIVGLVLWWSSPAIADAVFVGASPASNSTVGGTVTAVQIVFNEVVTDSTVTIEGPDGPVGLSELVDSGQVISASFPELRVEGRYIVRYAVTSADADPVDGVFGFTYREDAPDPLPVVAPALAENGGRDLLILAIIGAGVALVVFGGVQAVVRTRRLRQLSSSKRGPSDG
jgi:methionine-rich copper-binding protein CopC